MTTTNLGLHGHGHEDIFLDILIDGKPMRTLVARAHSEQELRDQLEVLRHGIRQAWANDGFDRIVRSAYTTADGLTQPVVTLFSVGYGLLGASR
jgi:hypothetical protein